MKRIRPLKRLTRADLVTALSTPQMTRRETMDIVKRYMGDSPVPPAWSYAGVRGTFGNHIARLWARRLRHRPSGVYRDANSGRWLHPVTQTAYDFGTTPEALRQAGPLGELRAAVDLIENSVNLPKGMTLILDEYHMT